MQRHNNDLTGLFILSAAYFCTGDINSDLKCSSSRKQRHFARISLAKHAIFGISINLSAAYFCARHVKPWQEEFALVASISSSFVTALQMLVLISFGLISLITYLIHSWGYYGIHTQWYCFESECNSVTEVRTCLR